MVIDQIFVELDGTVLGLMTALRQANRERNALRRGLQIIVDLHAGGEAEEIARAFLEEFVERRKNVGQLEHGCIVDRAGELFGSIDPAAGFILQPER